MTIEAPTQPDRLQQILARLKEFDLAIFISANAVDRAMNLIQQAGGLPPGLQVAAVGKASAKALKRHGVKVDIVPRDAFNSEALLKHPDLQSVADKHIVIFRGEGGRELLAETLRYRGASVEYAECYRRGKPELDPNPLLRQWARGDIDVVTVASNESLRNLYEMLGNLGRQWLQTAPIIGVSKRLYQVAQQLGIKTTPRVTETVSDDAMVKALCQWRLEQKKDHA